MFSLHNRRLMSKARRTWHFALSARRGEGKIKRLLPVHCSGASAHLRSQVLTDGGDVKRTNQNTIHYSKIVTFLATRNTDNSKKKTHDRSNCKGKITFNKVRLSEAKVRFAQSKFSSNTAARKKRGKACCSNKIQLTLNFKKLVNQAFS